MIRILFLISMVALMGTASAEVVDIIFPELAGDYELPSDTSPGHRATSFIFPPDVQSFENLRLVLSGEWVEGTIICSNMYGLPPDTTSFTPGLSMYLTSPGNIDGFFHATVHPPHGEFSQWNAEFEFCCPGGPGDLSELLGVMISAELFCDLILILPCNIDEPSFGILDEVRIEALGAVPDQGSSWGRVKALFR